MNRFLLLVIEISDRLLLLVRIVLNWLLVFVIELVVLVLFLLLLVLELFIWTLFLVSEPSSWIIKPVKILLLLWFLFFLVKLIINLGLSFTGVIRTPSSNRVKLSGRWGLLFDWRGRTLSKAGLLL